MTGDELREIRLGLDLSQGGLATRVGVHPNTVARWERGELSISEPAARLTCLLYVEARRGAARIRASSGGARRGSRTAGSSPSSRDACDRAEKEAVRQLRKLLGLGALLWWDETSGAGRGTAALD